MSEPRFTRGEYWLLEAVVTAKIPLCWLDWEGLEEILNQQGHGLSRPDLVRTLARLFDSGLIEAHKEEDASYALTAKQIEDALNETQSRGIGNYHVYGLTLQGGAQWEEFSAPDWNRFIDASTTFDSDEKQIGRVECLHKQHLEAYLQGLHHMNKSIREETMRWKELRPWQATYWKEFPSGWQVTYEFDDENSHSNAHWTWDEVPLSFYRIHENRWYRWKS